MSDLIECTALVAFSRFVSGHGIVHGDPENRKAAKVSIPAHAVQNFVDDGFVKAPKGFKAPKSEIIVPGAPAAEDAPPAEGEGEDGAPV